MRGSRWSSETRQSKAWHSLVKDVMTDSFPKVMKTIKPGWFSLRLNTSKIKTKKTTARHTIIKLLQISGKEKNLKINKRRVKGTHYRQERYKCLQISRHKPCKPEDNGMESLKSWKGEKTVPRIPYSVKWSLKKLKWSKDIFQQTDRHTDTSLHTYQRIHDLETCTTIRNVKASFMWR